MKRITTSVFTYIFHFTIDSFWQPSPLIEAKKYHFRWQIGFGLTLRHPHHGYTGWPYSWDYPSATLHLMMTIQNSWPNICNGVTCTCHSSYLNFKLYERTMLLRNYEPSVFVNTNLHIEIPQSTEMSSVDRGSECGLLRWICYGFSEIT